MLQYLFDGESHLFFSRSNTGFWDDYKPKKKPGHGKHCAMKSHLFWGQTKTNAKKLNGNCLAFLFFSNLDRYIPGEFTQNFFGNMILFLKFTLVKVVHML